MKGFSFLLLYLFCIHITFGQNTPSVKDTVYTNLVESGLSALKERNCQPCVVYYKKAFTISQKSALSLIRAATCAFACSQNNLADSLLKKASIVDFNTCQLILDDTKKFPEIYQFRNDRLLLVLQQYIDQQKTIVGMNVTLEKELKTIFQDDQLPRLQLDTINRLYGVKSPQAKLVLDKMRLNDSLNLIKIIKIIEKYGYPSRKIVGDKQIITPWIVIQHSPLSIQEKYFSTIEKAVEDGIIEKSNLALLVDRIRLKKNMKQLYGTQIKTNQDGTPIGFYPIEDEININKRRAEVGLPPIEEYARRWNLDYIYLKK